jgi:putative ABC transport system permease protein
MGAKRSDIIYQFLFEAVIISLIGGLLGIVFGVGTAGLISRLAGIPTIISAWSVLLSFWVAAAVGLAFGLFPARKAAREDPVRALRAD